MSGVAQVAGVPPALGVRFLGKLRHRVGRTIKKVTARLGIGKGRT